MHLIALGMNHKTAGIAVREKLTFNRELLLASYAEIMHAARIHGLVVVATCNRTEIYVEADAVDNLLIWFTQKLGIAPEELNAYAYLYTDLEAIKHLMQVASGLDSLVLGEVEILGQLKAAYKAALDQGYVTKILGRLFESAFAVAKQVRTQTAIGVNPVSVAYLAVRLAARIFTRISEQTVLLIGAGETAQLLLKHLYAAGVRSFIIANRSKSNAIKLACEYVEAARVDVVELNLIPEVLVSADIVVATAQAPLPLVGKGMVERAIKARKYRAMFMVDLAVPRNIEPQVQQIPDVYLYGIDDLQSIAAEHKHTRSSAIPQAETIITQEMEKFLQWLDAQQSVSTIQAFRRRSEMVRDQSLQEALRELDSGKDAKEVLARFAHVLLNRLLHEPTLQLRKAGVAGNKQLLNNMRELFEI